MHLFDIHSFPDFLHCRENHYNFLNSGFFLQKRRFGLSNKSLWIWNFSFISQMSRAVCFRFIFFTKTETYAENISKQSDLVTSLPTDKLIGNWGIRVSFLSFFYLFYQKKCAGSQPRVAPGLIAVHCHIEAPSTQPRLRERPVAVGSLCCWSYPFAWG